MINEKILYFIWTHQYFNKNNCVTTSGENVMVLHAGTLNTNQGPDFLNAKVVIGNTTWAGNVEIHVKSSDWSAHGHSNDPSFKNIVLHVVYEHDKDIDINVPTIELKPLIANSLLQRYTFLMNAQSEIACAGLLQENQVNPLTLQNWEDRLLLERLEHKSELILERLTSTDNHWEEVCWQWIARYFGSVVNRDAFEEMAQQISYKLIAKHKHNPLQIEAMLLGQLGLLDAIKTPDHFSDKLKQEYTFLQNKYRLQPNFQKVQFLRLRPPNFPTIRIAQLTKLVIQKEHLFASILQLNTLKQLQDFFNVQIGGYWLDHYQIGKLASKKHNKQLSESFINQVIINVVAPILFAYGHLNSNEAFKERAIYLLENITAEQNHITKIFTSLNINIKTAAQSQSYLQLYHRYCTPKKCLQCAIGNYFLGR